MKMLLGFILLTSFLWVNYKIISADIKEKKIPNNYLKYLLFLLPIWYTYIIYFNIFGPIEVIPFILQTFLTLIISFFIFHFGLWGAGDAKYLLVLSLFIPHIGIIPFIGNIAFITLIFLLFYFIWFWIGPNLWSFEKRKNIYSHLWKIKKEKFIIENKHKTYLQIIREVLKIVNIFFIAFISLRLIRIHIVDYISDTYDITFIDLLSHQYGLYILLSLFGCIILISLGIRLLINYIKNIIGNKNSLLFLIIMNLIGILFFTYEYIQDSSSFINNLILIFSLYLGLFLLFKVLLLAYKLVFIIEEENLINIHDLRIGMVVDKAYLYKKISNQKGIKDNIQNIRGYISEINTSIEEKDIKKIIYLHSIIDAWHQKNNSNYYSPNGNIQITQTFAYSIYIFLAFLCIGFFGINILERIINILLSFFL